MIHTENTTKETADILHSLLKLFSMFKIIISYDTSTDQKKFPDAIGIMCTNFGKTIVCKLDNRRIEYFDTVLVTNVLFQHVG